MARQFAGKVTRDRLPCQLKPVAEMPACELGIARRFERDSAERDVNPHVVAAALEGISQRVACVLGFTGLPELEPLLVVGPKLFDASRVNELKVISIEPSQSEAAGTSRSLPLGPARRSGWTPTLPARRRSPTSSVASTGSVAIHRNTPKSSRDEQAQRNRFEPARSYGNRRTHNEAEAHGGLFVGSCDRSARFGPRLRHRHYRTLQSSRIAINGLTSTVWRCVEWISDPATSVQELEP